jgi:2'-5' RNA ligase
MGKRLFVSVDLDGLAGEVRAVQERFEGASGLRVTDPEQAHVTLKFLGDTDAGRVDDVAAAIERAVADSGVEPFEAEFGGLGVFPSLDYISVVWIGVRDSRGDRQLTAFHEATEAETTALGFDPEDHDFTPHATVARMDHAGGKEHVQDVVENEDPDVGTLAVEEVRLTESILRDDGPEYHTVESVPL